MYKEFLLSLDGPIAIDLETVSNRVFNDPDLQVKKTVKWEIYESQPQWSFPTVCSISDRKKSIVIENLSIFHDVAVKKHLMNLPLIGHNLFFDLAHLKHHFNMLWTTDKLFCTLIAEKQLTRGLPVKCDLWSTLKRRKVANLFDESDNQKDNWSLELTEEKRTYCLNDVQYLHDLVARQLHLLKQNDLLLSTKIHLEVMNEVVLEMQANGIPVDHEYAQQYYEASLLHAESLKDELTLYVTSIEGPPAFTSPPKKTIKNPVAEISSYIIEEIKIEDI